MKLIATCPKGLEALLADELRELGAEQIQPTGVGVRFQGELEVAYRACLWSRLANRVLLPVTRVPAPDADRLYTEVRAIRWERHLRSDGSLAVDCTASASPIGHTRFAALKVKDAIVDRFREQFDERPDVDTETPDLRIHVHLAGDQAELAIDLAGVGLHRRGYRKAGAAAPLRENLAAGILLLAGWPEIAARGGSLLDPMCGSGTLLIEGALIAADIAPGLSRDYFGFLGWKRHDKALWDQLLNEAEGRRRAGLTRLPAIVGYDRDTDALAAARDNAQRAGLADAIHVERRNLAADIPGAELPPGLLATNPPWGERLGEVEALRATYALLGDLLRTRFAAWRGAVFTANDQLGAAVGLKPEAPLTLQNGPTACRLLRYPGAADRAAQVDTGTADAAEDFANRLRKNLKHLSRWAKREGVTCYRLYDQDLPEYAMAVDLYQGERQWVHVQEYEAPRTIDPDKAIARLHAALATIPAVLAIPSDQVFLKVRRKQKGTAQYEKLAQTGRFHEVMEHGCRLLVNFTDYLDTGLFLDHRPLRHRLQQEATGKRFLNLFCYTGVATVHAAVGGAKATTSVDLSRTYLDWAQRNLALNGFSGGQHEVIAADCLDWLAAEAGQGRRRYDLIFLDPPTFSTSKRMEGTLDIQRDHVKLIHDTVALLAPGGTLYFSNNFRKFRLDTEALADLSIDEITRETIPEDFKRRQDIHRCWRIRRG